MAIKIFNSDIGEEIQQEVAALFMLKGFPNIVQVIAADDGNYVKPMLGRPGQLDTRPVNYIVLQLAERGELYNTLSESGPFSEPIARNFFK